MTQQVTFDTFVNSFSDSYKNNFSYDGKIALFDYLVDLEEQTGETYELDTIALCCDYTEFDSFEDFQKQYQNDKIKDLETLNEYTTVIPVDNAMKTESFIIANF